MSAAIADNIYNNNIKIEQHSFSEHDYCQLDPPVDPNQNPDPTSEMDSLDDPVPQYGDENEVSNFEEVQAENGGGNGQGGKGLVEDQPEWEQMMMFNGRQRRNAKKPEKFKIEPPKSSNGHGRKRRGGSDTPGRASSSLAGVTQRRVANNGAKKKAKEDTKYEVEYIWGKRLTSNGKTEYRVFWKNYSIEESTWEPEGNLIKSAQESIDKYEQRDFYFNKKGEDEYKKETGGRKLNLEEGEENEENEEDDEKEEEEGMMEEGRKNKKRGGGRKRHYPLKRVLPTMRAPPTPKRKAASRAKKTAPITSIPPMPKKKKLPSPVKKEQLDGPLTGARKRKGRFHSSSRSSSSMAAGPSSSAADPGRAIEQQVAKLTAASIEEIVDHELSDVQEIPFFFRVRYGDGAVKKVALHTLVEMAPKMLAVYLADQLHEMMAE